MRKRSFLGVSILALIVAVGGFAIAAPRAFAQTSTSPNYQMTESQFGNASSLESCSEEYCARVSIGDDAKASSASSAEFGKANYSEPMLEMIVESGPSDLGELSTERTGTKIMKVKIRNYESSGYLLQIVGTPPKYKDHTLHAPSNLVEPMPGTEQFAINVVANTIPQNIGENPKKEDGADATSLVRPGYNTTNVYKYINGDTIAASRENSGGAEYTVTMIVNIANSTPAGKYSGDFAAVILPYY